jgi:hypothetical protein
VKEDIYARIRHGLVGAEHFDLNAHAERIARVVARAKAKERRQRRKRRWRGDPR